jgi:N-acetylneuraminic acid mutarotase
MESTNRNFRTCLLIALSALTACGGGSGGGGGSPGGGSSVAAAPVITKQPIAQNVPVFGTATFTVSATANGTLSYQWFNVPTGPYEPVAIPGGTSARLTISSVTLPYTSAYIGDYYCVITNSLNGTTAKTTSSNVALTLLPRISASLTGEGAVLPGSTGHVVSTGAQAAATYTWAITNGTVTAGQGSDQITYTAGPLGRTTITVTVLTANGMGIAIKNVPVVASLPIVSVFAQSSVLPGSSGILASTTQDGVQTYGWTLTDGTASATVTSGQTSDVLTYSVGASTGSYQITLSLTDALGHQGSALQALNVVDNTFLPDPRDPGPRTLHTATLLNDGRVLVAGGDQGIPNLPSGTLTPAVGILSLITGTAELFDPATNNWAYVGSLSTARFEHTATLLNDGRVLVVGGSNSTTAALASTEIYDPAIQTWNPGPSLATPRALHTATLLSDGRVLVAGGVNSLGAVGTAEIYDPVANTWASAGTMNAARVLHSTTLLPNGQVLFAGGVNLQPSPGSNETELSSAELYSPMANTWTLTASMPSTLSNEGAVLLVSGQVLQLPDLLYDPATATWSVASVTLSEQPSGLNGISATLLPDGRVLATGGYADEARGSAIYDPLSQSWSTAASLATGAYSTTTALANGQVLNVGGAQLDGEYAILSNAYSLASAALFDPTANSWTSLSSGAHQGALAAAAILPSGSVLVSGGETQSISNPQDVTAAADLFDPTTNTWTSVAPMTTARAAHDATVLTDGSTLATGGFNNDSGLVFASAERYGAQANIWTPTGAMANARYAHSASLLGNGMVVVAGGSNAIIGSCTCTTFIAAAELYNPTTNIWTTTGSLATARYAHTATVLPNGNVLVAGGFGGTPNTLQNVGAVLASAEIYSPTAGTWSPAAPMNIARSNHTATLLPMGQVLVVGGSTGTSVTATAEIYDPTANTWTPVASLTTARQSQSAVLLPTGNVLVVGGYNGSYSALFGVGTAELYDPTANTFTPAGSMVTVRQGFTLSGLPDGRTMLVGGLPNVAGTPEFYK